MSHKQGLDQAEGLRRMLGPGSIRIISFVSAVSPDQKNQILQNLAAALVKVGSEVHLLDASQSHQGISSCATSPAPVFLSDINTAQPLVSQKQSQGIYMTKLSRAPINQMTDQPKDLENLSIALRELSPKSGFCLVDTHLDNDNPFVLPELAQGDVVVIAANTIDSIKSAYLQIKTLHSQLGRRSYQILVIDASPHQAAKIQQNMSQATNLFLAVPLTSLGSIPSDTHLSRAVQLGRSVLEAFPMADASVALRDIATRLADKPMSINTPFAKMET
jgi:flagellar biosynthesis protein FlhG